MTPPIEDLARDSRDRMQLWSSFIQLSGACTAAEVGVYRGAFAEHVLTRCAALETYYMIDPWRHLEDWNKPANRDDEVFGAIFDEAMERTSEHEAQRVVLRGTTVEVIDSIPDGSLDFAYIDGDHTLRGIAIDLVCTYPKIRDGGWIGGDDFAPWIWQHGPRYEPTLVFPFAVHFAEAVGARIYGLPHNQYLIEKRAARRFEFADLTGKYARRDLLGQIASAPAAHARPRQSRFRRALRRLRR
jgi:hypothetical protein